MALSNLERVGKGLELLRQGLAPWVEREFVNAFSANSAQNALRYLPDDGVNSTKPIVEWDVAALLRLMWDAWREVFGKILGQTERNYVSELREVRNRWAHQTPQNVFTGPDTERALDTCARLLTSISSPLADDVSKIRTELQRTIYEEQLRNERRRGAGKLVESADTANLKPWNKVVTPHADVQSGRYQQAEFAADLWEVYKESGSREYLNPVEFFRRTYLTRSLADLLEKAILRVAGKGGDPVVQLQTNFGGGKTHSMLALYHLFGDVPAQELPGLDSVLKKAGVATIPEVKRAVLVGTKLSPANPLVKGDGTQVRTLWGEIAWQLGGRRAYDHIRIDDEQGTNPGDKLKDLLDAQPCLILIDEWVAYARQLHENNDLAGGTFDTHFTFAQALTESAKAAGNCLLVISLPASDTAAASPHAQADEVEVGGVRGREALDRLRNVIGRVESSWRPATAEEGFEIVRRRLFEPLTDREQFVARDNTARSFSEYYAKHSQDFPAEVREGDYEKRIKDAYPIHPEIFDRLYQDWSVLVKFQRTRGVLRLMAAVIHAMWEKGDANPLILPATIPIDDLRVQPELTRYLPDQWAPIIERDIDGPNALPLQIDNSNSNLGRLQATRRVARTIYLGSAPLTGTVNRGIEDRRIKLGCAMPGESPAIFGDALRYLSSQATYLYQDGTRYWYSTQPTVTKMMEDRAEQFKRTPEKVQHELEERLKKNLAQRGEFSRVHSLPQSSQDVGDEMESRLVVLGIDHTWSKDKGSGAEVLARQILEYRGNQPRIYRNTLVFLVADRARVQDLDEAARRYLAWQSILDERDALNLAPLQVRQAENQRRQSDEAVSARIPEAWCYLLEPQQSTPQSPIEFVATRLTGPDALAVRAWKRISRDERMVSRYGGTNLRRDMDRVPLWRGDHVAVSDLIDYYARYLYLQRVTGPDVILEAVSGAVSLLSWQYEGFAYAEAYDEKAARYVGLRANEHVRLSSSTPNGLAVKSEVAQAQIARETAPLPEPQELSATQDGAPSVGQRGLGVVAPAQTPQSPAARLPKRYHATAPLKGHRVGADAARIADEVLAHLATVDGAEVKVTIEIHASTPSGFPESVQRIVNENGATLRFISPGFEVD